MKIKLSQYWWYDAYLFSGMIVVYDLIVIVDELKDFLLYKEPIDVILILVVMFSVRLGCFFVFLFIWKWLMIIEVQDNRICSYLFGKMKCEVLLNQKVYYAIFESTESRFSGIKTYLVISNELFICKDRMVPKNRFLERRFIDHYDCKKQIILPYNEKTMYLFEVEKWEGV